MPICAQRWPKARFISFVQARIRWYKTVVTLHTRQRTQEGEVASGFYQSTKLSCRAEQGALVRWLKLHAWNVGDRGSNPAPAFKFQRSRMFLPSSFVKIQYCGEPPWPRGSKLGVRPPGLKFRSLCLEGSVISFISPSSGCSPGPV